MFPSRVQPRRRGGPPGCRMPMPKQIEYRRSSRGPAGLGCLSPGEAVGAGGHVPGRGQAGALQPVDVRL
eukprot:2267864-Pyramimonas_sp.AAC.1